MLQIENKSFASDALEDAMRLAQVKALNSFTFSDCLMYLNYAWRDIYDRMAMIDDGYYGTNVRITEKLTKLPPFVKNTVQIYEAQSPVDSNRLLYRNSGTMDMTAPRTYKISGTDLYVPDAERKTVWLYYVPMCKQIFFTHHNRDPKIHDEYPVKMNSIYNLWKLKLSKKVTVTDEDGKTSDTFVEIPIDNRSELLDNESIAKIEMVRRTATGVNDQDVEDVTDRFSIEADEEDDGQWKLTYISCDYPYIFASYKHSITGDHKSGFFDREWTWNDYNPFSFIGRDSNVEYIATKWNDKTGMGVVIRDWNDTYNTVVDTDSTPSTASVGGAIETQVDGSGKRVVTKAKLKELGWTPDTLLDYPIPEMYRYLVARLADKFSALNESNIMGVQKELVEARFAFESFLDRDKSAFKRMVNVNPPTVDDWL